MNAMSSEAGAPGSCVDIARRMVKVSAAGFMLDSVTNPVVSDEDAAGALRDALGRCGFAEDHLRTLVLTTPAATFPDAVAQIVAAIGELSLAHAMNSPEEFLPAVIGGLVSALRIISKAASIDPAEFGASEELFRVAERIRSEG